MATQVQAMALPAAPTRSAEIRRLLGRIALVIGGSVTVSLVFSVLYLLNDVLPPATVSLGAALAAGVSGGIGARGWLRDASGGLRWATAFAAAALGQAFLGWLTWGFAGIRVPDMPRLDPDWTGLLRFGLGSLAASLSLRAWATPRVRLPQVERPPRPVLSPRPEQPRADAPWSRLWRALRGGPRAHVHLTGRVEHRCPYCLEPVEAGDPRGEVTCPICHTRHHADCWAVTGVCQVPHHNA